METGLHEVGLLFQDRDLQAIGLLLDWLASQAYRAPGAQHAEGPWPVLHHVGAALQQIVTEYALRTDGALGSEEQAEMSSERPPATEHPSAGNGERGVSKVSAVLPSP